MACEMQTVGVKQPENLENGFKVSWFPAALPCLSSSSFSYYCMFGKEKELVLRLSYHHSHAN